MTKLRHFTVEGVGPFPLDMLRYDLCWPKTQDDVRSINLNSSRRAISLSTVATTAPTIGRWESFGWAVIEGGTWETHHKATPVVEDQDTGARASLCRYCNLRIQRVPGGSGPTWVHTDTGAVAGSGAPFAPSTAEKYPYPSPTKETS